jgi:hypothetical protein
MTTENSPLCDATEFVALMTEMVTDDAPKVFAVVEELGTRHDARIAGWGLAYETHVDVIGVDGAIHLGAATPENVLRRFGRQTELTAHIIWPSAPEPEPEPVDR